jgi:CheY-like chemotaxis protein
MASGSGILLIDEDTYSRVVLGAELEACGRPVWATACPATALAWAQEHDFAIALVDGQATGFSALQVARRLRLEQTGLAVASFGGGMAPGEFPAIERPQTIGAFLESLGVLAAAHAAGRRTPPPALAQTIDRLAGAPPLAQTGARGRARSVFERLRTRLSA